MKARLHVDNYRTLAEIKAIEISRPPPRVWFGSSCWSGARALRPNFFTPVRRA